MLQAWQKLRDEEYNFCNKIVILNVKAFLDFGGVHPKHVFWGLVGSEQKGSGASSKQVQRPEAAEVRRRGHLRQDINWRGRTLCLCDSSNAD